MHRSGYEQVFSDSGAWTTELPAVFQSTLVVDVVLELQQEASAFSTPWASASAWGFASQELTGELRPAYAVVQEYARTGATTDLGFTHHNGALSLGVLNRVNQIVPVGLTAVGQQPVTIQLAPSATQLVIPDVIVPAPQMSLQLPHLPTGTMLYVQGFALHYAGFWQSSRSLRVTWF